MATFHQQDQRVQHQVNGEHVHVGTTGTVGSPAGPEVVGLIQGLIDQLRRDHSAGAIGEAVIPELERAQGAATRGDRSRLLESLGRAAELAPSAAAIATALAAIVSAIPVA